ncbi:MAG: hypothetical protein Q9186_004976 [Xanthomendoza sp. 1 TL-2023]
MGDEYEGEDVEVKLQRDSIDTFQEWPQLLDPTLEPLVTPIISAFVEYMENHSNSYHMTTSHTEGNVEPLPRAICKILHILCKVRGPKVLARFFSNEPALLEPMLDAFELWDGNTTEGQIAGKKENLTWEEKYVMLLWLSHLALTPFDLASISTSEVQTNLPLPDMFVSPRELPNASHRLLALGLRYLSSASKESEAAVLLLVRLSLRPDMQKLSLHRHCMDWALCSLVNGEGSTIFFCNGILSYLSGFFRSGDGHIVAPFIVSALQCMQELNGSTAAMDILGSAVARKLIVKIHRHLAVHLLSGSSSTDPDLLNSIFDHLLTSLRDKDNPVRFAASKALSAVAQKLDPDMTIQLVDDIVQDLQENNSLEQLESSDTKFFLLETSTQRNLSTVDPLHWHGLILTLSHLLYRHSAPEGRLSIIIYFLVSALDFEQRSPMGTTIGTGVRDAACFGIWSLARKYSTKELLQVSSSDIRAGVNCTHASVIEALARELVLTATLDPEGNVRRGASAALQELVGRHPDRVPNGIRLIQIVDYQAVGLRSRAMANVTIQAAALGQIYLHVLSTGLLSWRAISSPTTAIRHNSASVIGHVVQHHGPNPTFLSLFRIFEAIDPGTKRTAEEWHGLYLALAALIREDCIKLSSLLQCIPSPQGDLILLKEHGIFRIQDITAFGKGSELAIEALCSVIAAVSIKSRPMYLIEQVGYHLEVLEVCIRRCTGPSLELVMSAAVSLVNKVDQQARQGLIRAWLTDIQEGRSGQLRSGGSNINMITVIGAVLTDHLGHPFPQDLSALQVDVLVAELSKESRIGSKIAALSHRHPFLRERLERPFIDALQDYTIDSRGDIGSEVRLAAVDIIARINNSLRWDHRFHHEIFGIVCGLAVEKLDKVRECAWNCIRRYLDALSLEEQQVKVLRDIERMGSWSTYSVEYFVFIFKLAQRDHLVAPMLRGFVTSAGVGSEVLVRNSRIALLSCLTICSPNDGSTIHETLLHMIHAGLSNGRLFRPGLEVLSFLLDVGPVLQHQPSLSHWQALLRGLAQVHASTDLPTLQAVIALYSGLLNNHDLHKAAISKLYLLLCHRYPSIRLAAATALWVADRNDKLKALDLSLPSRILRPDVQTAFGYSQGATYYNIIKGGQFLFKIRDLHELYGPIIRIGPNEIHINDPEFYDKIYSLQGRWNKDPAFVNQFDNTDSAFGTIPHELHRIRRRAFNSFFSKQKIISLEPMIQFIVDKLCKRLESYSGTGKEVPIRHAYECMTNDIIMEFALGKGDKNIEHPDFNPELHETIKLLGVSGHYMKLVPGIELILPVIPPWIITGLVPAMKPIVALQKVVS